MSESKLIDESRNEIPLWGWCLFLLGLWQFLLWAQNPSVMSDDSGEMIAASYRLGISHPPGYPLFCLLGRSFSFVPLGTVAFRFNLLSGFFVLLSLSFFGLSCFSFLKSHKQNLYPQWVGVIAGLLALFCLFSCRSVFAQALTAKGGVYTLTLLFLSVFLWLRIRGYQRGLTHASVLFVLFLWSLGLSNHWESEVLWIPFIIYWFYQEKTNWDIKRVFQALSIVIVGLSLYLYLPLRASLGALPAWGDPKSFREFVWVVTRESYRGLEPLFKNISVGSFFKEYFKVLSNDWMPGFAVLVLVGLVYLRKNSRSLFYSTLAFYLPVVFAIFAVANEETKFLMAIFLVSTEGLLTFFGFVGLFFSIHKLSKLDNKFSIAMVVILLTAVSFWMVHVFKSEDKSQYYLSSDFSINALKTLPSKSIFLAEGDSYVAPLFYERFVQGLRPDVVFVPSIFLFHDWGWRQLAAQDAQVLYAVKSAKTMDGRLKALSENGNLYYTLDQAYLGSNLSKMSGMWLPWGLENHWVLIRPDTKSVSKKVLDIAWYERLRGLREGLNAEDKRTLEIYHHYANQYFSTGRWLREKGDSEDALRHFEAGLAFDPKAAYVYSDMAAIVGSEGYLELSRRLCLLGIGADPSYFPNYANLANVYLILGDRSKAQECYQVALSYVVDKGMVERNLTAVNQTNSNRKQAKGLDKNSLEYQVLAKQFTHEGMAYLGGLAEQIGRSPEAVPAH